uniref:C2H2-type domain-containing protein n=1 Tax=Anopheles minimus TaxID=112268 RepID=A0A182VZ44_9DIPT
MIKTPKLLVRNNEIAERSMASSGDSILTVSLRFISITQVCSKVFGNASALAKHKLTHSDERKYVCGMCSKAFKRQDHLNGHMLTHRNKKPYECKADGCGKSYCDARSLRRHTENHHSALGLANSSGTASPGPGGSNAGPPGGLSLSPATAS